MRGRDGPCLPAGATGPAFQQARLALPSSRRDGPCLPAGVTGPAFQQALLKMHKKLTGKGEVGSGGFAVMLKSHFSTTSSPYQDLGRVQRHGIRILKVGFGGFAATIGSPFS